MGFKGKNNLGSRYTGRSYYERLSCFLSRFSYVLLIVVYNHVLCIPLKHGIIHICTWYLVYIQYLVLRSSFFLVRGPVLFVLYTSMGMGSPTKNSYVYVYGIIYEVYSRVI